MTCACRNQAASSQKIRTCRECRVKTARALIRLECAETPRAVRFAHRRSVGREPNASIGRRLSTQKRCSTESINAEHRIDGTSAAEREKTIAG